MVKVSFFCSGLLTAIVSAVTVSAKPAASGLLLPQFLLDPSNGLSLIEPDVFANVSKPCVDEFQRIKTEYKNQSELWLERCDAQLAALQCCSYTARSLIRTT